MVIHGVMGMALGGGSDERTNCRCLRSCQNLPPTLLGTVSLQDPEPSHPRSGFTHEPNWLCSYRVLLYPGTVLVLKRHFLVGTQLQK